VQIALVAVTGLALVLTIGILIGVAVSGSDEESSSETASSRDVARSSTTTVDDEQASSRRVAESFMSAIGTEDYSAAAALTCTSGQIPESARELEQMFTLRFMKQTLNDYKFTEYEADASGRVNNVTGRVRVADELETVIIGVDEIDDRWCVYSFDREPYKKP
jgi:hypothetical protein